MPTRSTEPARRTAVAVGPEVPRGPFGFRVHSAFARALNLAVEGRRALVTLTDAAADEQPQGIRLATHERFDAWPVAPGDPGRCDARALVFDAPPGGRPILVTLPAAGATARRAPPRVDVRHAATREAWRACAARLEVLQAEKGADLRLGALLGALPPPTPLGARLAQAARALGGRLRAGDAARAGEAAAALVGLGTGLTPSGDDLLCGVLAALACTHDDDPARGRFRRAWGAGIAGRLAATTAIGATFLECAIAGSFPGRLRALAAAIADAPAGGPGEAPRAALERLCAQGHSSGMDTATGLLFGLWLRIDEEARRHAA